MFKYFLLSLALLLPGCNHTALNQKKEITAYETFYDEITLELVCVKGFEPDARALAFFVNKINQYDIARIVNIHYDSRAVRVFPMWNSSLIRDFEQSNRKLYNSKPKSRHLVLFVCYLPGVYVQGNKTSIVGLQYGDSSFAIFRENADVSFEGIVLLHELGHIMRIARSENRKVEPVNPDRPNHCNNERCAMFWRASEHRTELDSQCLAELQELIKNRNSKNAPTESLLNN